MKLIYVFEINPGELKIGTEFKATNWPLHITLVQWFNSDLQTARTVLNKVLKTKQIETSVIGQEYFKENLLVSVVDDTELKNLHKSVLNELDNEEVDLISRQFVGDKYRPHITHQIQANNPKVGDRFKIDTICIVEAFKDNGVSLRRVLDTVKC